MRAFVRAALRRRPAPPPPSPPVADPAEAERQERRLYAAFAAGEVPAVWYRHGMAVLAADAERAAAG
jgi:hypothetical protein